MNLNYVIFRSQPIMTINDLAQITTILPTKIFYTR